MFTRPRTEKLWVPQPHFLLRLEASRGCPEPNGGVWGAPRGGGPGRSSCHLTRGRGCARREGPGGRSATHDLMMLPSVWSSLLMVKRQALGTFVSLLMVILRAAAVSAAPGPRLLPAPLPARPGPLPPPPPLTSSPPRRAERTRRPVARSYRRRFRSAPARRDVTSAPRAVRVTAVPRGPAPRAGDAGRAASRAEERSPPPILLRAAAAPAVLVW